jgi:hypothetical protein
MPVMTISKHGRNGYILNGHCKDYFDSAGTETINYFPKRTLFLKKKAEVLMFSIIKC